MKVQVYVRNVYGNAVIYPACEQAKLFAKLAKQTTLTHRELKLIQELGYQVEQTSDPAMVLGGAR